MVASNDPHPTLRLYEKWDKGTTRPGADVVAELYARAPNWVRRCVRPLTPHEEGLWRVLADRARMGVEVFRQVPIHVPEADLGCAMTFFLPRFAARIELCMVDFGGEDLDAIGEQLFKEAGEDDALREYGGVLTVRVPPQVVATTPDEVADYVRWEFGLIDDDGRPGVNTVAIPR